MVCALQLVPVSKKLVLIYVVSDVLHKGYYQPFLKKSCFLDACFMLI